jgi:hypothetical protein
MQHVKLERDQPFRQLQQRRAEVLDIEKQRAKAKAHEQRMKESHKQKENIPSENVEQRPYSPQPTYSSTHFHDTKKQPPQPNEVHVYKEIQDEGEVNAFEVARIEGSKEATRKIVEEERSHAREQAAKIRAKTAHTRLRVLKVHL